jgi:predicted dehydrogenase
MVSDPDIDAVSLALPPSIQAVVAQAAAAHGKHLFCEKPAALNTRQVHTMLRAAERARVVHAMNFIFPELLTWRKCRDLLRKRRIGQIRSVAVTWRLETFAYRHNHDSWKRDSAQGGGTLNNFVSHSFYYLEWMFGRIARLSSRLRPGGRQGEARVDLWLEFAAGFPATVSVAADAFLGPGHRLEIYGNKGTLLLENPTADYVSGFSLKLGTRSSGSYAVVERELPKPGQDGRVAAMGRIAGRFVNAIHHNQSVTPGLKEGLRVQKLIDAVRLADRRKTWCSVA